MRSGGEPKPVGHSSVAVLAGNRNSQSAVARNLAQVRAASTSGNGQERTDGAFALSDIWRVIVKRHAVVLLSFVLAVAVGLAIALLQTPIFRATAMLQMERQATRTINVPGVTPVETTEDGEFYETELQLLGSRVVTEQVAANLDVDDGLLAALDRPTLWDKFSHLVLGRDRPSNEQDANGDRQKRIYRWIQSGLIIEPVVDSLSKEILVWHKMEGIRQEGLVIYPWARSLLVRVHFEGSDRLLSARIANAVADYMVDSNIQRRHEANAFALEFLRDRIEQIKLLLQDSEKALADRVPGYRQAKGSTDSPSMSNDLASLSAMHALATEDRIDAEVQLRQSRRRSIYAHPQMLENQAVRSLRTERWKLESDYQDKLLTYMPDYPVMLQLRSRIKQIDQQLAAETQNLKSTLVTRFSDALDEESMLKGEVATLTQSVLLAQGQHADLSALERDVAANQQLYAALLQRYQEISATSNLDSRNISLIDAAVVPDRPVRPDQNGVLKLAVFSGFGLGLLMAFVLEAFDRTVRRPEQIEKQLGIAVLGVIPSLGLTSRSSAFRDLRSSFSEAYRSARTALEFSTDEGAPRCLLVTSPSAGDGKTTSALTLARDFAQLGRRVLLIDADMRNPSLHRILGAANTTGLSNYLSGGATAAAIIRPTRVRRLIFIPAGPMPPNPAELLAGAKMAALVNLARQRFDHVIIDGPPVMGLADAPILASLASGTLMVIAAQAGPIDNAKLALKRLLSVRARVVGALLSKLATPAVNSNKGGVARTWRAGRAERVNPA